MVLANTTITTALRVSGIHREKWVRTVVCWKQTINLQLHSLLPAPHYHLLSPLKIATVVILSEYKYRLVWAAEKLAIMATNDMTKTGSSCLTTRLWYFWERSNTLHENYIHKQWNAAFLSVLHATPLPFVFISLFPLSGMVQRWWRTLSCLWRERPLWRGELWSWMFWASWTSSGRTTAPLRDATARTPAAASSRGCRLEGCPQSSPSMGWCGW